MRRAAVDDGCCKQLQVAKAGWFWAMESSLGVSVCSQQRCWTPAAFAGRPRGLDYSADTTLGPERAIGKQVMIGWRRRQLTTESGETSSGQRISSTERKLERG